MTIDDATGERPDAAEALPGEGDIPGGEALLEGEVEDGASPGQADRVEDGATPREEASPAESARADEAGQAGRVEDVAPAARSADVGSAERSQEAGPADHAGAASALTEQENAVLDLEETWWTRGRNKTEAIATLGVTPTRYYLLLNRILANPQARMERPELVGRLLRLRHRRAAERRMGNVPPGDAPTG